MSVGSRSDKGTNTNKALAAVVVGLIIAVAVIGYFAVTGIGGKSSTTSTTSSSSSSTSSSSTATKPTSTSTSTSLTSSNSTTIGSGGLVQYIYPAIFKDTTSNAIGAQLVVAQNDVILTTIKLNSNLSITGNLEVQIRQDIVWLPDATLKDFTNTVNLVSGTNTIALPQFAATVATCSSIGCTSQYFLKVFWNGNMIYDPTDRNNRENIQVNQVTCSGSVCTTTSSGSTTTSTTTTTTVATWTCVAGDGTITYVTPPATCPKPPVTFFVTVTPIDVNTGTAPTSATSITMNGKTATGNSWLVALNSQNTLNCGTAVGYTTLTQPFTFVEDGAFTTAVCSYAPQNTQTVTLPVHVEYCNKNAVCLNDPDTPITVQNVCPSVPTLVICTQNSPQTAQSDANGNWVFGVKANSQYTVSVPPCASSPICDPASVTQATVNVGTSSPPTTYLRYVYLSNVQSAFPIAGLDAGLFGLLVVVGVALSVALVALAKRRGGGKSRV